MQSIRMRSTVDILTERIGEAADLIVSLRTRVQALEHELLEVRAREILPPSQPFPSPPEPSLVEEFERLNAERAVIRERIRGLLREIDRVSW